MSGRHSIPLKQEHTKILERLGMVFNEVLPVFYDNIQWNNFGVSVKDDSIIDCGFYQKLSRKILELLINILLKIESLQGLTLAGNRLSTLPPTFGDLKSLQELILADTNLKTLPHSFDKLVDLKVLDLSKNEFKDIPDSLKNLKKLEGLHLSNNKLTHLPDFILHLRSLKILDLGNNLLTTLPEHLDNLESLQELYLYYNKIITLPKPVLQLKSLKQLSLSGNQITSLSESFKNLKNLQVLYLMDMGLKTFPEPVLQLESLQILYLNYNKLTTLPETFSKLKSIKELYLNNNDFKMLPAPVLQLKSLQVLVLENNQLSTLPESLLDLPNLTSINVYGNPLDSRAKNVLNKLTEKGVKIIAAPLDPEQAQAIEDLEKLIGKSIPRLLEVEELDVGIKIDGTDVIELGLSEFDFKTLPESFGNLKALQKLYLTWNQLETLPESFGNLESLQKLILYHDRITDLPESFGNLKSLRDLSLSMNFLRKIPEQVFKLKSLQSLRVTDNGLTTLPKAIGELDSLQELHLQRNQLKDFPESILKLKALQILYLNSNQLTTLPDSIEQLESLQDLALGNNSFRTIPWAIWSLKNLKRLDLSENPLSDDSKEILKRGIPDILEYCRANANINVFISHAVVDFDYFHIEEIAQYLAQQREIHEVYYCEEALRGNIDEFMNETIPKCQLLIFFASRKSLFDSMDCAHELELAKRHNIPFILIKREDVEWDDLIDKDIISDQKYGFHEAGTADLCNALYKYIKQFKQDMNIARQNKIKLESQLMDSKDTIINFIESGDFELIVKENLNKFIEIFEKVSDNQITPMKYIQEWEKLLSYR